MFPKSTKILIVDDMSMFRQMVKQALTELDYKNFTECPDGANAWAALEEGIQKKSPFQLIISDWTMPKMKGIELLKKVRAEAWGKKLPFIMLTGETEKDHIVEAVQSGVSQYIIKPFSVGNLKDKLKQTYDKWKAENPDIVVVEI